MLQGSDDVIEDQYFEKIALDNGIPHQIHPKTFPEKGQAFSIRQYPFPGDNEYHPAYQYSGGNY